MPEPQGHKNKWVTLKGGTHVYLNGEGNITKGPKHFVGKNISALKYESDTTPVSPTPKKAFSEYKKESKNDVEAALNYYKGEMQGHYVDTKINGEKESVFFSRATGDNKNDLLKYMNTDSGKAEFVPYISKVIASGSYKGREDVKSGHSMEGVYSCFHKFEKTISHNGNQYKVTAKIGEHLNGVKEFSFYYFGKSQSTANDSALPRRLALKLSRIVCDESLISEVPPEEVIVGFEVEEVNPVFAGHFEGLNAIRLG